MPRVGYPFYTFQGADGFVENTFRVYLPIRLSNPDTKDVLDMEMALVDTGADSCVIPGSMADSLGHNLKHKAVKPAPTFGINGTRISTYGHTFRLELLDPTAQSVVWSSDKVIMDCVDSNIPILLGTQDFLAGFRITIDYPGREIFLEW